MSPPDRGTTRVSGVRRVLATSVASQVTAAVAIASTAMLGLAVSDTYAIGLQVGNGALTGVALGVVYFLAIGRPGFRLWARWKIVGIAYAMALLGVTLAFISRQGSEHLTGSQVAVMCVLGGGGALLGVAGVDAVREACLGRPLRISSLTLIPNGCLILGSGVALVVGGRAGSVLPAVAWAAGCAVTLVLGIRSRTPSTDDGGRTGSHTLHALGLTIGTVVATFMPPLFLSAVSGLEAGTATVLLLVTRVGGSAVGVATNSVLVTRYSWASKDEFRPRIFELLTLTSLVFFAINLALQRAGTEGWAVAAALVWWLTAIVSGPFVNREVNAQRRAVSVMLKGALDLAFALVALWVLLHHPSPIGYLSVVVLSQALTVLIGAATLGHVRLAALAGVLLATGWVGLLTGGGS